MDPLWLRLSARPRAPGPGHDGEARPEEGEGPGEPDEHRPPRAPEPGHVGEAQPEEGEGALQPDEHLPPRIALGDGRDAQLREFRAICEAGRAALVDVDLEDDAARKRRTEPAREALARKRAAAEASSGGPRKRAAAAEASSGGPSSDIVSRMSETAGPENRNEEMSLRTLTAPDFAALLKLALQPRVRGYAKRHKGRLQQRSARMLVAGLDDWQAVGLTKVLEGASELLGIRCTWDEAIQRLKNNIEIIHGKQNVIKIIRSRIKMNTFRG